MAFPPGPFQLKLYEDLDQGIFNEDISHYLAEAELCDSKHDDYPVMLKAFLARRLKHKDDGLKPPFTTRQLIAMVLLSHPYSNARQFEDSIVRTIFYSFDFYHGSTDTIEIARKQQELTQSVGEELDLVDSPFTGYTFFDEDDYTHAWVGIRHDLKDHTLDGTVPETKFDFLRLPPELRVRIYEHALSFELMQLHGNHGERAPQFRRCFCPDDNRHAFDTYVNGREIACADPSKLLGLLSVNRQIYQEAAPLFYSRNEFFFHNMTEMHSFFRGIGPFRRRFIRNVIIIYGRPGDWSKEAKVAKATFKMLSEALSIRSFRLYFKESYVLGFLHNAKVTKPEHVPGLKFLHDNFRGIPELCFVDCPRVKEYLMDAMGKPAEEVIEQTAKKDEVPVLTSKRSLRPRKSIQYKEADKVD